MIESIFINNVLDEFTEYEFPSPALLSRDPDPAKYTVNVSTGKILTWTAGEDTLEHDVYFGTDPIAVYMADTATLGVYNGRQDVNSFVPEFLGPGTTYYWRVDEVNDLNPDSPWMGSVWTLGMPNTIATS